MKKHTAFHTSESDSSLPLGGLKVVEIGVAMAGPFCGMLLGDYGADVVKIERPGEGDDSRAWSPYFHDSLSYYYAAANRNKRCLALNLKSPEGVEIARKLISEADVLVHNFRSGVLERLGLGWDDLSTLNPRLIYCSISGFGKDGPLATQPANDLFMQAYSGGMSVTGEPGGSPAKMGISIADIGAGMFATIGILTALQARERTGQGQRVDTSLLEGQISMLAHFLTRFFASGEVPGPSGSGALSSPIYRAFQCSDEWIVIAAFNQKMWRSLCKALERPEWVDDERFHNAHTRRLNRDLMVSLISDIVIQRPLSYWKERLTSHGVPCSPVNRIDTVVAEEQVHACEMVQEINLPDLGLMRMAGLPIKLGSTPGDVRMPPPRLGQHTEEILQGLGLAPEEIRRLASESVVELDQGWRRQTAPDSTDN